MVARPSAATARARVATRQSPVPEAGATAAVKASAQFAAFASGKHGLRAVAQSMAKELGPRGIHVAHAIIDGVIDVPRVHETMPDFASAKGEDGLIDPASIAVIVKGEAHGPMQRRTTCISVAVPQRSPSTGIRSLCP